MKDFEVIPGAGVGCKVWVRTVLVGNKKLMRSCNVPVCAEVEIYFSDNEKLARTSVLVAIVGKIVGAGCIILWSMSIRNIMVTDDNRSTVTAIAKEIGIENVFAESDKSSCFIMDYCQWVRGKGIRLYQFVEALIQDLQVKKTILEADCVIL